MAFFCFPVDQRRKVRSTKPAAGICSRCGGGARIADMETATRFCYVPVRRRRWRAVVCTSCGAVLRSYRRLNSRRPALDGDPCRRSGKSFACMISMRAPF